MAKTIVDYGHDMRDAERLLRADGYFDAADMMRCLADGLESGEPASDVSVFDRGRIEHVGPCFGLPIGHVPSGMGRLNVEEPK